MASSPTASSDSVFAHLVRAPEDPILGVTIFLFSFSRFRSLTILFYFLYSIIRSQFLRYFDLIRIMIIIIITAKL
jgi:hypothetical protein